MALPTQAQVVTLDYPSRGGPFAEVVAKSTIDATTLDYPSRGVAFFAEAFGAVAAAVIRTLTTVMAGF